MKDKNKHPYGNRKWWRDCLPWLTINLGIAGKGKDRNKVDAQHYWYKKDSISSACYYCKVVELSQKWKENKRS